MPGVATSPPALARGCGSLLAFAGHCFRPIAGYLKRTQCVLVRLFGAPVGPLRVLCSKEVHLHATAPVAPH
eukprot:4091925-Alexandrium_andersonii.AAC.1